MWILPRVDMSRRLYNTQLDDRILWYDGCSSYDPTKLLSLINKGYKISYVDYITPDILEYNRLSNTESEIRVKTESNVLDSSWNLPDDYLNLDVYEYIIDKHAELTNNMSDVEINNRDIRLADELTKFQHMNLTDVLRAIIYIINTLTFRHQVWGVGRGSSVSSYVLYVIGAHDVDSFAYELDINDFLHE